MLHSWPSSFLGGTNTCPVTKHISHSQMQVPLLIRILLQASTTSPQLVQVEDRSRGPWYQFCWEQMVQACGFIDMICLLLNSAFWRTQASALPVADCLALWSHWEDSCHSSWLHLQSTLAKLACVWSAIALKVRQLVVWVVQLRVPAHHSSQAAKVLGKNHRLGKKVEQFNTNRRVGSRDRKKCK